MKKYLVFKHIFVKIGEDLTKKMTYNMNIKQKKLGIIAGGGSLPQILINHCQKTKRDFYVLAIENNADRAIFTPDIPHKWLRIGQAGTGFKILNEQNVEEVIMIGTIRRPALADLLPDLRTAAFFAKIDRKSVV